jgi:site-specific recombinase XerD
VLWRAGLRINGALSLTETDLDQRRGSILVRHGKNDRRREVGIDAWGWTAIEPWLTERVKLPVGSLFCVIDGPTRGRARSASAARVELRHLALKAGVRRRFAPHQLRHAHAAELLHEGIALPLIQRQLGHSHPSTTGTYLEGINNEEIISTVHARRPPMMHASAGLALQQTLAAQMRSREPAAALQPSSRHTSAILLARSGRPPDAACPSYRTGPSAL